MWTPQCNNERTEVRTTKRIHLAAVNRSRVHRKISKQMTIALSTNIATATLGADINNLMNTADTRQA
ncbi:hypothetical protein QT995_02255 [Microcoleus sp. S36b_A3]|uniref:hypothetical protein n=1 Tax=Microcoleaceae TaxID=1892252 RepID=UPI0018829B67|nr:hypothetical protein [Tychonema sp. LEGE 06208]MBE9165631.1 hypothetical protein [Tychonema sp. LEGE 06208]